MTPSETAITPPSPDSPLAQQGFECPAHGSRTTEHPVYRVKYTVSRYTEPLPSV